MLDQQWWFDLWWVPAVIVAAGTWLFMTWQAVTDDGLGGVVFALSLGIPCALLIGALWPLAGLIVLIYLVAGR